MARTDLDWLTGEASAEEVRRLMRLLQEWSQGDENSFPVQLALLTRAQWRAAARVPQLLRESEAQLDAKLGEYRREAVDATRELARVTSAQKNAFRELLTRHEQVLAQATSRIEMHQREAGQVAQRIQRDLERGAAQWEAARGEFEAERERLVKAREDLERRRTWEEWMTLGLVFLTLLSAGVAIGCLVARVRP